MSAIVARFTGPDKLGDCSSYPYFRLIVIVLLGKTIDPLGKAMYLLGKVMYLFGKVMYLFGKVMYLFGKAFTKRRAALPSTFDDLARLTSTPYFAADRAIWSRQQVREWK